MLYKMTSKKKNTGETFSEFRIDGLREVGGAAWHNTVITDIVEYANNSIFELLDQVMDRGNDEYVLFQFRDGENLHLAFEPTSTDPASIADGFIRKIEGEELEQLREFLSEYEEPEDEDGNWQEEESQWYRSDLI